MKLGKIPTLIGVWVIGALLVGGVGYLASPAGDGPSEEKCIASALRNSETIWWEDFTETLPECTDLSPAQKRSVLGDMRGEHWIKHRVKPSQEENTAGGTEGR